MTYQKSAEAIRWLMDEIGVDLRELSQLGGHARKRTHRAPPTHEGDPRPVGWAIMQAVQDFVRRELAGQVEIRTSARVVRLEVERDGTAESVLPPRKTVTGVVYEDLTTGGVQTLHADAVVLASGGYGCDLTESSLLMQHRPDLMGSAPSGGGDGPGKLAMPSTNGAFATGDGVKVRTRGTGVMDCPVCTCTLLYQTCTSRRCVLLFTHFPHKTTQPKPHPRPQNHNSSACRSARRPWTWTRCSSTRPRSSTPRTR
jgi:succinate dehydrogenase/fumarate reductase flavoprotein subunit